VPWATGVRLILLKTLNALHSCSRPTPLTNYAVDTLLSAVLGMILPNCIVILILIIGSELYHDTDTSLIHLPKCIMILIHFKSIVILDTLLTILKILSN